MFEITHAGVQSRKYVKLFQNYQPMGKPERFVFYVVKRSNIFVTVKS